MKVFRFMSNLEFAKYKNNFPLDNNKKTRR